MKGLSTEDAKQALIKHGYNELQASKPKNLLEIGLSVIKEPMFLLLLSCAALYIFIGDHTEGLILLSAISLIIVITFLQTRKTERALDALRQLSAPRALVRREGTIIRIPGREVVPGDLVILTEGDRVPADGIVLEETQLTVDESLITGESMPVTKDLRDKNEVFGGTLVVSGHGLMRVNATGTFTQMGKIAGSLTTFERSETALQKELRIFIRRVGIAGVAICLLVIALFYFTRHDLVQALLIGLSSAMAILPEEFPVVLTVFLALGAWRMSKNKVLTRWPGAIESLGSATVLCTDKTGTLTMNRMHVAAVFAGGKKLPKDSFAGDTGAQAILLAGAAASVEDSADPMDNALFTGAGVPPSEILGAVVREYPLTKELLVMAVVRSNDEGKITVHAKGAPEHVFKLCGLSEALVREQTERMNELAENGYRVLAVAKAGHAKMPLPEQLSHFSFSYLGLLAFEDPIRPEVPAAIRECFNAGVRVLMITGDFSVTARSIGKQAGLAEGKVVTGSELEKMSDEQLQEEIHGISIFARAKPEHKLRIVRALQQNNEVVAMTGDGVNDAPALKAADIGIAMGNKGTDVSREAAALVLLDDNFASIVGGLRLGRRIFDNLQKAMAYIMSIHVPIIGLTLMPALIPSMPILLMPLHIVFMELIIDPVCSIAFESEEEEKGIMHRAPRDRTMHFFGRTQILSSVFHGSLLLGIVLLVYWLSANEGHSAGEARAIAFSTLVLGNIFLIVHKLSKTRIVLHVFRNIPGMLMIGAAMLILFLVMSVPALAAIFSFEFPGYGHFLPALAASFLLLLVLEIQKLGRWSKNPLHLKNVI